MGDELRRRLEVPLIEPSFVAEAALRIAADEETGRAWVVQPSSVVPFRFPGVARARDEPALEASRGASIRRPIRTSGTRSPIAASRRPTAPR